MWVEAGTSGRVQSGREQTEPDQVGVGGKGGEREERGTRCSIQEAKATQRWEIKMSALQESLGETGPSPWAGEFRGEDGCLVSDLGTRD